MVRASLSILTAFLTVCAGTAGACIPSRAYLEEDRVAIELNGDIAVRAYLRKGLVHGEVQFVEPGCPLERLQAVKSHAYKIVSARLVSYRDDVEPFYCGFDREAAKKEFYWEVTYADRVAVEAVWRFLGVEPTQFTKTGGLVCRSSN